MHSATSLLLLLSLLIAAAFAGRNEGPILRDGFSLSGQVMKDTPFALHWNPSKNIAGLFISYPTSRDKDITNKKGKDTAYFAHVWSLDQDRVITFYDGFNISFCHEYPVVGSVPPRFWHSVQESGHGQCEDGTSVTWYEGKFNPLFVPYGVKTFRIGYNKAEKPTCVEIVPFERKKKDDAEIDVKHARVPRTSSMMIRHLLNLYGNSKKPLRFGIDYDDTPPSMTDLFPDWLVKACNNDKGPALPMPIDKLPIDELPDWED